MGALVLTSDEVNHNSVAYWGVRVDSNHCRPGPQPGVPPTELHTHHWRRA